MRILDKDVDVVVGVLRDSVLGLAPAAMISLTADSLISSTYSGACPVHRARRSVGRRDARSKILFVGVQTVYNKAHLIGWCDLLLIGECHLPQSGKGRYRSLTKALRVYNPNMPVVGLTASPYPQRPGFVDRGRRGDGVRLKIPRETQLVVVIVDGAVKRLAQPLSRDAFKEFGIDPASFKTVKGKHWLFRKNLWVYELRHCASP
jgi:hypothetical protein